MDFPHLKDGELPDVAPPVLTPMTMTRPEVITRKTGENLRLPCEAIGRPEPDVHWERLGARGMMAGGGAGVMSGTGRRASLVIDNLKESDSGVFACVATNMIGTTSRNFTLKVEDGSGNPSLPGGPRNTTVKLGERGQLECHIMSRAGAPEVKWLKKVVDEEDGGGGRFGAGLGGAVFDVGTDEKFRMVRAVEEAKSLSAGRYVDVLVFDETDAADAGLYYCFVTNKVGYKYKSAYLNVLQNGMVACRGLLMHLLYCMCLFYILADSYVTSNSSSPGGAKWVVVIAAVVVAVIVVTFCLIYCFCKNKGANLNNSNASSSTKRPPTSTSMADDVQENLMPQQQQQQQLQQQQQQHQPIIKPHPHHYHYQQQQYQASMNNNRNAALSVRSAAAAAAGAAAVRAQRQQLVAGVLGQLRHQRGQRLLQRRRQPVRDSPHRDQTGRVRRQLWRGQLEQREIPQQQPLRGRRVPGRGLRVRGRRRRLLPRLSKCSASAKKVLKNV